MSETPAPPRMSRAECHAQWGELITPTGPGPHACWIWSGMTSNHGTLPVIARNQPVRPLMYEAAVGHVLPPRTPVYRTCPTALCVRPGHMTLSKAKSYVRPGAYAQQRQPRYTSDSVGDTRTLFFGREGGDTRRAGATARGEITFAIPTPLPVQAPSARVSGFVLPLGMQSDAGGTVVTPAGTNRSGDAL